MLKGGLRLNRSPAASTYYEPFHEKPAFQYIKLLLIIATLAVGVLILFNTNQITGAVVSQTISTDDFLSKLTSHDEMKAYVGVTPSDITPIDDNNLANLQAQISGLDESFIGSFIVQYTDKIVIYNYNNDQLIPLQQPQQTQLPADFLSRLNAHPELSGLENEQPIGGQLDQASLDTLRQQFPQVYANAKVGDFLLRYTTRLIIYDYNADFIVNAVNLG